MSQPHSLSNKKGLALAIVLFCFQLMTCFIYSYRFGYAATNFAAYVTGDVVMVVVLIILAIVGFALLNAYITNASFSGMAMSLLVFVITIQHYFFVRAFWYKAGTALQNSNKSFGDNSFSRISFVNIGQDQYANTDLTVASLTDAIACAICMILALGSVIGRIQFLQAFVMTAFGAWFYQVNYQLFFRFQIDDVGFGMRVFLFAGVMSLVVALLLGRKDTTINHAGFYSSYSTRGISLLGFVFTFCAFPFLCASELYHTSINRGYIAYIGVLNMYLALGAGVLGSFVANSLTYRKIHTFDLIYTGLSGGIVFSSSVSLHRNPTVPLTVGFVVGIICTINHAVRLRNANKNGVTFSLGVINRLIIPGFLAGILSSILVAVNQGSVGNYIKQNAPGRSPSGQAGFQLIGLLLTIGIALVASLVIGLLVKLINKHDVFQQFNDNELFISDVDPTHSGIQRSWREIE